MLFKTNNILNKLQEAFLNKNLKKSKIYRFGRTENECNEDERISKAILSDIMKTEKFLIWNYETMIYLGEAYFRELYKFIGVTPDDYPNDLIDGNQKYLL